MSYAPLLCLLLTCAPLAAADLHVDPRGDDAATGTSWAQAWRSLARASRHAFQPGDRLLLAAGAEHQGTLRIEAGGTRERPLVITASVPDAPATGGVPPAPVRATIRPGTGDGIVVANCGGVTIADLDVASSGRLGNRAVGIRLLADRPGIHRAVVLERLSASGFHDGILVESTVQGGGFAGVRMSDCAAFDNAMAGIRSDGLDEGIPGFTGWSHSDVHLERCRAYDNPGIAEKRDNHSGNGILIGCVDGVLIEHCEAFGNGGLCNATTGGPVGIWLWECNRGVIQHCISHHNRLGPQGRLDGGGFDFDGGVTNSLMQYNTSHDNVGAGYLVCQYAGARPLSGNVLRFNLSIDDGRANGYAGIHLYNGESAERLRGIDIHHNTVVLSQPPSGRPAALCATGPLRDVRVIGNLFIVGGDVPHVKREGGEGGLILLGNGYAALDGRCTARWGGADVTGLEALRAVGQERDALGDLGLCAPPPAPAAEGWIRAAGRLPADSPFLAARLDPRARFALDPGPRDVAGTALAAGMPLGIGAHQGDAPR